MATRRIGTCECLRPRLPLSSSFLFLSIILPSSSYAQLAARAAETESLSLTLPTTSPDASAFYSDADTTAGSISDPSSDTNSSDKSSSTPAFNYYFVILAALAILTCVCLLLYNRRRRRKAAILRSRGQHALARDVESFAPWRGHFRGGNSHGGAFNTHFHEGLDERGEAPPAYFSGDKPPGIQETVTAVSPSPDPLGRGDAMELTTVGARGSAYSPPSYDDSDGKDSKLEIRRPQDAVPAPHRPVSIRSVLSHSETSAHQGA